MLISFTHTGTKHNIISRLQTISVAAHSIARAAVRIKSKDCPVCGCVQKHITHIKKILSGDRTILINTLALDQ